MISDNIITVKPEELAAMAERLRYDAAEPMDYLRDIVGMDWGEEGLGALYYMECTSTGSRRVLKTATKDRERAFDSVGVSAVGLPSVENGKDQGTRGVRFLRHPLHGKSGHAPHLPARGLEGIPSAQGLRYGFQSAEHGE